MTKKGVVDWWVSVNIATSSIARSAKQRYLSNSDADFEVSLPRRGNMLHQMGVKLSIGCKNTAIGNGNLQPEIEINEYSSGKKLLE